MPFDLKKIKTEWLLWYITDKQAWVEWASTKRMDIIQQEYNVLKETFQVNDLPF